MWVCMCRSGSIEAMKSAINHTCSSHAVPFIEMYIFRANTSTFVIVFRTRRNVYIYGNSFTFKTGPTLSEGNRCVIGIICGEIHANNDTFLCIYIYLYIISSPHHRPTQQCTHCSWSCFATNPMAYKGDRRTLRLHLETKMM